MEEEIEGHEDLDQLVNTILKHLSYLQFYPLENKSTRSKFVFTAMLFIALQPVVAIYYNWQHWNFKSRVSAVDNLVFSIGVLGLSSDVYLLSQKLRILIDIIRSNQKFHGNGSRMNAGNLFEEEPNRFGARINGRNQFEGVKFQENDGIFEKRDRNHCEEDNIQEKDGKPTLKYPGMVEGGRGCDGRDLEKERFDGKLSKNPGNYTPISNCFTLRSEDSIDGKSEILGGGVEFDKSIKSLQESKFSLLKSKLKNNDVFQYENNTSAQLITDGKSFENLEENGVNSENLKRFGISYTGMCSKNSKIRSSIFDEKSNLDGSRLEISTNINDTHLRRKYFLKKKRKLVKESTLEGSRRGKSTTYIITYFFISFTFIPLSGFVSYFLLQTPVVNLPLPFLIYSPFSFTLNFESFFEYFLLTLVELFYIYYTSVVATSVHVLQLLAINNLLGEMKLFNLITQEIEGEFEDVLNGVQVNEVGLRLAVRQLVVHHQTIFRKVKGLNHGSNFRIFYVNSYICFQIVFGIFIFLKGEFIYRIKYGVMVITIGLLEFIFSENGQRLQDEGEELRMALYYCNWIGKPAWFTKTLQIMMIRSNHLPKLGLLNLFTLNRNNVTVIIRGAYSYFSLLNKFSS